MSNLNLKSPVWSLNMLTLNHGDDITEGKNACKTMYLEIKLEILQIKNITIRSGIQTHVLTTQRWSIFWMISVKTLCHHWHHLKACAADKAVFPSQCVWFARVIREIVACVLGCHYRIWFFNGLLILTSFHRGFISALILSLSLWL